MTQEKDFENECQERITAQKLITQFWGCYSLAVEATVDASRADAGTWLAALNDSSWRFLEATIGAFDEDYEVFSQHARAYLISRDSRLVPGEAHGTHHYDERTHDAEASPSSMSKEPIFIDISDNE